jgi:hypothetical protein
MDVGWVQAYRRKRFLLSAFFVVSIFCCQRFKLAKWHPCSLRIGQFGLMPMQ